MKINIKPQMNVFIFLIGLIISVILLFTTKNFIKFSICIIILATYFIHSAITANRLKRALINVRKYYPNGNDLFSIEVLEEDIYSKLRKIKSLSKDNKNYSLVLRFLTEINKFEEILPILYTSYKKAAKYVLKNESKLKHEIKALKTKIRKSKGNSYDIYMKSLEEHKQSYLEIKKINEKISEIESKIYYISSIFHKVITIIDSNEIFGKLTDSEIKEMNTELEVFSENIVETLNSINLNYRRSLL